MEAILSVFFFAAIKGNKVAEAVVRGLVGRMKAFRSHPVGWVIPSLQDVGGHLSMFRVIPKRVVLLVDQKTGRSACRCSHRTHRRVADLVSGLHDTIPEYVIELNPGLDGDEVARLVTQFVEDFGLEGQVRVDSGLMPWGTPPQPEHRRARRGRKHRGHQTRSVGGWSVL